MVGEREREQAHTWGLTMKQVPYRDAVLRYFNMLISADPGDMQPAVQFWTGAVKSLIVDKFTTLSLNDWEQAPTWDLRLSIGHHHAYLFRRLIDLTSIRINKKILDDLDNSQHMFDVRHFLDERRDRESTWNRDSDIENGSE